VIARIFSGDFESLLSDSGEWVCDNKEVEDHLNQEFNPGKIRGAHVEMPFGVSSAYLAASSLGCKYEVVNDGKDAQKSIQIETEEFLALNTKDASEVNSPGQPLSCVMLNVSDELKALQSLLVSHLSKDDLDAKGVEDEPHITIRFGLHTQDADSMIGFANLIQPIRFTVNGVASFSSKEYDVLFLTVESPELVRFNELLGKLPNTQTHPKYVPHLTLAYVKPGTASACIAKLPKFDPVESVSNSFVFSNADKNQTTFILGGADAN
jgi:2'-5' RNA ligase